MNDSSANYPAKTCELDRLVTHKKLVDAVVAGSKTQQRRNGIYGYPGERFEVGGKQFEITRLVHEPLDAMDDAAAQAEGYPSLEMYKDLILRMHKGMEWDGSAKVWMHEFAAV